jgi:hypothetical protein
MVVLHRQAKPRLNLACWQKQGQGFWLISLPNEIFEFNSNC